MEWTNDRTDENKRSESDLNEPGGSLFKRLQEIRKQKKISLEAIAESLRVQLKYLKALEEGDLANVPEVYDKLFFRSYLKALDLPVDEYYEQFLEYRRSIRLDKTTTVFEFGDRSPELHNKFNPKSLIYLLPIMAVVILIWILFRNTELVPSNTLAEVEEIDIRDIVADLEQKQFVPVDSDSVATVDSLALMSLQLRGLKRTWFRVITDRSDTAEFMLPAGNTMTLTGYNRFEFLIGRADGLKLRLNEKNLPVLGNDSTVIRYLLVDSTGIVTKQFVERE